MRLLPRLPFRRRRTDAMACREAVALLSEYLEGALRPEQRQLLADHLRDCTHCAEYLEQIRASIRLAGLTEPGALDPQTRAAMIDLYRTWQEDP